MRQIEAATAITGTDRHRVESVVQTLATLHNEGESVAEIAHDARNMVTALGLYCDLLEEPGVLAPAFAHYGGELRLVAAASRRLVEKLVALDEPPAVNPSFWRGDAPATGQWPARLPLAAATARNGGWDPMPSAPVANLAAELLATRNLLAALAGPSIALTVDAEGGALPALISGEDLTRVLVNLVKNAVEAMPSGGRIQIALHEQIPGEQTPAGRVLSGQAARESDRCQPTGEEKSGQDSHENAGRWLALAVEDSGPGIPADALEKIFASGYTGHAPGAGDAGMGAAAHRGLGLAITRSIVENAGGRIHAENRARGGARMVIDLPAEEARK